MKWHPNSEGLITYQPFALYLCVRKCCHMKKTTKIKKEKSMKIYNKVQMTWKEFG